MRDSFPKSQNASTTEPGTFRGLKARTFRGPAGNNRGRDVSALAIAKEYREIVPRVLRQDRRTAKIIALRVDSTQKSVENWREGINGPSVPYFIALAREIPELRRKVLEWLDADNGESGEDPQALAQEIAQFIIDRGRKPA
jgi:hypothetical protein